MILRRLLAVAICCAALFAVPTPAATQVDQLLKLSLDSLLSSSVSTASKYEQRRSDAPAFVSIVTAQDIRRFGYGTLEDVLQAQVGFYLSNDREYADVGIRGFGRTGQYNNKILLLIDGHVANQSFTGGARVGTALGVSLADIERIEIVRGPGSSLYGARAMLAVINMVTRTGRDRDGWETSASVGTRGQREFVAGYGGVLGLTTDLALSLSWGESDGEGLYFPELDFPHLNNGRAEGIDWTRYARALASFRSGGLTLHGAVGNRTKGIPTAAYQTAFNHPDAQTSDMMAFAEARYDRPMGKASEVTVRAYFDTNRNEGVYPFGSGEGAGTTPLRAEPFLDVRSFGGEARVRWDPSPKQRIVLGVETVRVFRAVQRVSGDPRVSAAGDYPYSILSAFIHDEFQLNPDLSLTLGFRRDQYSIRGSATTPRAALVYHPDPTNTVKAMAGMAFRAPNLLELYVTQPAAALLGNPNLDPEKIRTLELLWEHRFPRVATTLSVFHNRGRDLVDLVEIAAPDSLRDFGRIAFQQQNISNVRSAGLDVEARLALPGAAMARGGYSFLGTRDDATGSALVNAPRHQARLSLETALPRSSHLGVGMRAESGRNTIYGNSTKAWTVVDASLRSAVLPHGVTFQMTVKNVLDTRYNAPGGFQHVQSAIPQTGRLVTVRLGWNR